MRLRWLLTLFTALIFAACSTVRPVRAPQGAMTYPIGEDSYAVVVVQEPGAQKVTTRNRAYAAAAELTLSKGMRYFVVEREQQVQVLQSDVAPPEEPNLYQKLIMEKDSSTPSPTTQMKPGLRLEIRVYKEKPNERAIDASRWAQN